ncbi:MAG: hypothetical protein DSY77_04335 [Bacteroidetes bacterium]|nr:MAG: hypothetical protein DSY77_04335 [Bacteroidota bacterium]
MKLHQLIFVKFLIVGLLLTIELQAKVLNPCDSIKLSILIQEFDINNSPNLAKQISKCYEESKKYENALNWHRKAIEITSEKLATDYFELAKLYFLTDRKVEARECALNVLSIDSSYHSKVYTLIGDLYVASYKECKDDDLIKSRAVYIAAYEMYKKANNKERMELAENQFPSGRDVFHIPKGELVQVACWIGEEVELKFRREK